jgi:pyridoxine 5-phosphate synthase
VVEIHTGHYASASRDKMQGELDRVLAAIDYSHSIGLTVNAGHGLNCGNVSPIAAHPAVSELNIGHSIIARSVYVGIEQAVREIKDCLCAARKNV